MEISPAERTYLLRDDGGFSSNNASKAFIAQMQPRVLRCGLFRKAESAQQCADFFVPISVKPAVMI